MFLQQGLRSAAPFCTSIPVSSNYTISPLSLSLSICTMPLQLKEKLLHTGASCECKGEASTCPFLRQLMSCTSEELKRTPRRQQCLHLMLLSKHGIIIVTFPVSSHWHCSPLGQAVPQGVIQCQIRKTQAFHLKKPHL